MPERPPAAGCSCRSVHWPRWRCLPAASSTDIELTYFQDSNWLHAPLWLSDHFQREAGVSIASRELYDGGDTVAKVLPQLLSRNPRFDWVQFPSLFFGAFAETGMLEPLDDYFEYDADARTPISTGSCRPTASSIPSGTAAGTA